MMFTAANDSPFEPLAVSDPAFIAWAVRVGLRLSNKGPGAHDDSIERSLTADGAPSPEWAQALGFMVKLVHTTKRA